MKSRVPVMALGVAVFALLTVVPASAARERSAADVTGCTASSCMSNQITGFQMYGCPCSIDSFNWNKTSYAVDPNGPQGDPFHSQSPVTFVTGNQVGDVELTFTLNGAPVGVASTVASGQQSGIFYTSDPMNLIPGSNTVTITADDPLHLLAPLVYTVTIPYVPPELVNNAPPLVQGTPAVGNVLGCTSGLWAYAPAPTHLQVEWDQSSDGSSWTPVAYTGSVPFVSDQSVLTSFTVGQPNTGQELRCVVTATNGVTNVTVVADSAPTGKVPGQPPAATTTTTTETTTTPSGGSNPAPPPSATTTPAQPPAPSAQGSQPAITKSANGSVTGATVNLRPTVVRYTRSLAGALSLAVGFKITVSAKTVYILHGQRTTGAAIAKAIKKVTKVTIVGRRHGSGPFIATKITVA